MIVGSSSIVLGAVVLFAAALAYRVKALSDRKWGYFSLLQILYLVVVPGFVFTAIFSYVQNVISRPLSETLVFTDELLVSTLLLSVLFAYGGIAIHSVSKMLAHTSLRFEKSEAARMNKYFHTTFSHSMIYSGAILGVICMVILEMNHMPMVGSYSVVSALVKGVLMGGVLMIGMYSYVKSDDDYGGRWYDLRTVFLVVWLGIILIAYVVQKMKPDLLRYELLFPVIISFSLMAFLNIILVVRRIHGRWKVSVDLKKLK